MSAVLSACGTYRYALWREIQQPFQTEEEIANGGWFNAEDTCLFVMLNPSTADASQDDPTIRRCIGFAKSWGFGRLAVANLYALRATDPSELGRHPDPVGPDNDQHIVDLANDSQFAIAAWGSNRFVTPDRIREVVEILDHDYGIRCLGRTADGSPRHPLYVPKDVAPVDFGFDFGDAA